MKYSVLGPSSHAFSPMFEYVQLVIKYDIFNLHKKMIQLTFRHLKFGQFKTSLSTQQISAKAFYLGVVNLSKIL